MSCWLNIPYYTLNYLKGILFVIDLLNELANTQFMTPCDAKPLCMLLVIMEMQNFIHKPMPIVMNFDTVNKIVIWSCPLNGMFSSSLGTQD